MGIETDDDFRELALDAKEAARLSAAPVVDVVCTAVAKKPARFPCTNFLNFRPQNIVQPFL